jgi:hypothetical protein
MMLAYLMGRLMAGVPLAAAREGYDEFVRPRSTPEALVVPAPIAGLLEGETVPRSTPDATVFAEFFDDDLVTSSNLSPAAPAVNITIEDRRSPMPSDAYLAPVPMPTLALPVQDGLHARAQRNMVEQREALPSPSHEAINPRT